MPSRSHRLLLSLVAIFLVAPAVLAHDVTLTGTQSFASLDGSANDHDGVANGVFTVNDGNLVVGGVVNCNDDGSAGNSACGMAFSVSGNLAVNAGGALYAENRSGSGSGGAIALTVGGNLTLSGNAIISSASTSNSANANGGAINATVAGGVAIGAGTTIDSGSPGGSAGSIALAAGGVVAIDGNVLAGPSRAIAATRLTGAVLTGGGGNQNGGQISFTSTTFIEPAVLIGATANVVSQGENAVGSVKLDGCGVEVRGLVASISRNTSAVVVIRSGKGTVIDGRDLGAAGLRHGRVRADSLAGTAAANRVDIFVSDSASIHGPATGLFSISSNTGTNDPKGEGGSIRVVALAGGAVASGNAVDAGGSNNGNGGGTISIDAAGDATLATASLRAAGDHTSNNSNRDGGAIRVRSYSGNVVWTNGIGDVRPLGSASNLPLADQGSIVLTACGTINTIGSTFPVNGTATSVHPQTQTGVCSPAAPALPAGTPPLVTCNTPPVAIDTAAVTNEDTTVTLTLSGTDADGDPLTFSIVSGPANGVLGAIVSTGPTTATVNYTPNPNFNGGDSFVYKANDGNGGTDTANASIVVNAVNDPPSFLAGPTVTVLEDAGSQTYANWATAISPGPADESSQSVTFTVTNDNPALFSVQPAVSSTGTLTFTAAANAYGSANITVTAQDNGGTLNGGGDTSAPQTSSITVTGVNDEPSFTSGPSQTANEDAGAQTVTGWATAISAGPNEGSQTVSFVASNNNNALFSAQPSVSSNGTLTYTPAANANGSATVTIYAQDSGGTANGGDDTSASQTFTITVNAVNDEPSFTSGGDVIVLEDSTAYSAAWAASISAGPADESGQSVTFTVTNDNPALFSVQPAVSSTGTLTFTAAANAYGSANITVTAQDNGGTLNGGDDTSASQTSSITVTGVNDEPSFTSGPNQTANEDAGAQTVSGWAAAISAGSNEGSQTVSFVASNSNNALFSAQPSVSSNGTLTYTPAANANGTATVTIYAQDDGGTANGGDDTSASQTFTITVNAVNDAPSFTGGGDVTVNEDSGAYSAAWATSISAGPADENGQTLSFSTSYNNAALFAVAPAVSSTGVLSFTLNANAFGSATVTVTLSDNGGTANGGDDTSASQTFTITVNNINDEPTFTAGGNVTRSEDSGAYSAAWASSVSAGPNEGSQTVSFSVTNDNNGLFASQPSISASGVLSFTTAANAYGTATVTVFAQDDGGTANGGDDTSSTVAFTITVNPVNDAPSFTGGGNVTVGEDSGAYSGAWATAISAGPANESSQMVSFVTSNNNNALFSVQPSVSSAGVLSFTPNVNATGTATVTIYAQDNGGTANGGVDVSASQTFTISVSGVNDPPSFTPGANQTSNEDAGPQTVVGWATGISPGAGETDTVTFVTSNDNPALFSAQPSVAPNGTLTYTASPNANGTATVTIHAKDNGGTANGGNDTSASYTFTIAIVTVNDAPSFTGGGNVSVLEDAAPYSAAWATAISAGPADEAGQTLTFNVSNNNNSLFSSQPAISASGVLSFTLSANVAGSATVTVSVSDNGGTGNGGADTSASQTFTINVAPVNDAPSFVGGGNVTVNEDSGPYAAGWATSISAGPNETQIVSFNTSNNNNALFLVQPSISSTGVLSFTPALNAFGTATVTVTLSDNGGTANGGVDTSAAQTFAITVTAVNDAPTAANDSWQTLGNTELRVDMIAGVTPSVSDTTPSGNGVRDNDSDPEGDPSIVTGVTGCSDTSAPFDCTLGGGAKVSMLANGSFSYTPAPGATSGSFQYTVTDVPAFGTPASATGTVSIAMFDTIWYVNGAAAPGGNGTSSSPFVNFAPLSGATDIDAPGHTIFVQSSAVTGSIDLEAGQKLWGQGIGLSKPNNLNGNGAPTVVVAAGSAPVVTSPADVVTVEGVTGVEIAGLTLNSLGGNAIDVTSTPFGSPAGASIYSNTIMGAGLAGIEVNAGSSATNVVNINQTSINSAGNGLDATTVGTLEISYSNGTATSTAGSGIVMNGTNGSLTVTGLSNVTVHGNTVGDGIKIIGATFDAVPGGSFDPVITGSMDAGSSGNPVGGSAVILSNVSGDVNIGHWQAYGSSGGVIVSGSGLHTGSAGMRISNSSGVISASAGVGLSVSNSTIGSGNLNFTSVSSTGGANGILLNNTGSSGRLQVAGSGTAGSGGTIQNATGDGISLTNTLKPGFGWVNVTGSAGHGIKATTMSGGLTLTGCQVTNSGNAAGEHGLNAANVAGTILIDATTFNNAAGDLLHVQNNDVNATLSVVNGSAFIHPAAIAATTNAAISITANGTSAVTVSIDGSTFTNIRGDSVRIGSALASTGSSSFTFNNNTVNTPLAGRASSVTISGQGSTVTTISVTNNNFSGAGGNGVIAVDANDSSLVKGTIRANSISDADGIAIFTAADEAATARLVIDGNTIINSGSDGIEAVNFGGLGVSQTELVITNNTVNGSNVNPAAAFIGGIVFFGFEDNACVAMTGNNVINTPSSPTACGGAPCVDYHIEESSGSTMWEEVPNTAATTLTPAYIQSTNGPATASVTVFGSIALSNGASCNRP